MSRWYGFTVEIECERSTAAYEAWQQTVYSAVMTAYLERLANYQDRLAALQIQQGSGELGGRNPAVSRQLERTELKRSALSITHRPTLRQFRRAALSGRSTGLPPARSGRN